MDEANPGVNTLLRREVFAIPRAPEKPDTPGLILSGDTDAGVRNFYYDYCANAMGSMSFWHRGASPDLASIPVPRKMECLPTAAILTLMSMETPDGA